MKFRKVPRLCAHIHCSPVDVLNVPHADTWITCTHMDHMYTHGSSCTHMDHMYTHGSHVHTWITCTHMDHMYTHGSHVHTWITCTHMDHMHTHGSHVPYFPDYKSHSIISRTPQFGPRLFRFKFLCTIELAFSWKQLIKNHVRLRIYMRIFS